jgi:hypothetical protein
MLREDSGKVSAARVNLASALAGFWVVFLVWFVIVVGLFFDYWPWERFHDAIVAGGLGLLGVIFGAVGGYTANKYAHSKKLSDVFEEDRWQDE